MHLTLAVIYVHYITTTKTCFGKQTDGYYVTNISHEKNLIFLTQLAVKCVK